MKKVKSLLTLAVSFAMIAPSFASIGAWTDTQPGPTTPVAYDNSSNIPDPDNPTNPAWTVQVPSSITFTDNAKKVAANVSMQTVNDGTMPTYDVEVMVASTNGYKLQLGTTNAKTLDYDLQYQKTDGSLQSIKALSGTDFKTAATIGKFPQNSTSGKTIEGYAILTGTATETGRYSDQLTYTLHNDKPTTPPAGN